jgi:hypothetical protein
MPRGAAIALAVVTLIWLCGCGLVIQVTSRQLVNDASSAARQSFGVSRTADYTALEPGRIAAMRVSRIG